MQTFNTLSMQYSVGSTSVTSHAVAPYESDQPLLCFTKLEHDRCGVSSRCCESREHTTDLYIS